MHQWIINKPISLPPCFSKILERVIYNYYFTHSLLKKICFMKSSFVFHSTGHAIVLPVNEILNFFDNNSYILGVFIDLTKAFCPVDHNISLKLVIPIWNKT